MAFRGGGEAGGGESERAGGQGGWRGDVVDGPDRKEADFLDSLQSSTLLSLV